jgi:hypothetical protein
MSGVGCDEQPLSWKLSIDQMKCIKEGWEELPKYSAQSISCVMHFLNMDPLQHATDQPEQPVEYCLRGYNEK